MSLGTLAINNNSDQVVGTGTSFTTELKVNDFIAVPSGGVTYTMVVKAIASNTSLTLTRPFTGPNVTGANWAAIPAGTMVGVTAKIADDTAYTMRMYVNEANNWMSLLTIDGEVTVYAPDGSSYTGPSWLKLSRIMGTLDMPALTTIAAQTHADAVQVAADTATTTTNKNTAVQAATTATTAAQSASQDAQTATTKAGEASASAVTAKNEADRAATANLDNQLKKANNLSDVANVPAARTNLEIDRISQYSNETLLRAPTTSNYLTVGGSAWGLYNSVANTWKPLGIGQGGTGATSIAEALANLGLGEGSALPVGVPVPWPSATPPTGWLKCNGATFDKVKYPKLATAYPSGVLPDLRGEFLRGWDDGRGVDVNRVLLSSQSEDLKGHRHESYFYAGISRNEVPLTSLDSSCEMLTLSSTTNALAPTDIDTSGKLIGNDDYNCLDEGNKNNKRTATRLSSTIIGGGETRPRNVSFNYIVRAA